MNKGTLSNFAFDEDWVNDSIDTIDDPLTTGSPAAHVSVVSLLMAACSAIVALFVAGSQADNRRY